MQHTTFNYKQSDNGYKYMIGYTTYRFDHNLRIGTLWCAFMASFLLLLSSVFCYFAYTSQVAVSRGFVWYSGFVRYQEYFSVCLLVVAVLWLVTMFIHSKTDRTI